MIEVACFILVILVPGVGPLSKLLIEDFWSSGFSLVSRTRCATLWMCSLRNLFIAVTFERLDICQKSNCINIIGLWHVLRYCSFRNCFWCELGIVFMFSLWMFSFSLHFFYYFDVKKALRLSFCELTHCPVLKYLYALLLMQKSWSKAIIFPRVACGRLLICIVSLPVDIFPLILDDWKVRGSLEWNNFPKLDP